MRRRVLLLLGTFVFAGSAACSAILGLQAPPSGDEGSAGDGGGQDGTAKGDDSAPAEDAGDSGDSGPAATCVPLDAGGGGAAYYPLEGQTPVDDAGDTTWAFFSSAGIAGFNFTANFAGGTFDGRYVYFAGQTHYAVRYDTLGGGFTNAAAWSHVAFADATWAFAGAVFDGRYVTFVPQVHGTSAGSVAVRYDTLAPAGDFAAPASPAWQSFDVSTLSDGGGALTTGFFGGSFDGRYLYFVPRNDGVPFGRVVRYDALGSLDAALVGSGSDGAAEASASDAGDASTGTGAAAAGFADPALWSSFDFSGTDPTARGFTGGVFASGALFFVPNANDAFDAAVHFGNSGTVVRYQVDAGFGAASSYTTFDTTRVNGLAYDDIGGAFDGRYVYLVPHATGVISRYDTTASFASVSAWSTYDTSRVVFVDGGTAPFAGGAFDGRFVYFVPFGNSGVTALLRYDTESTFAADCAWSSFDFTQLEPQDSGVSSLFVGAVFDGQYLYLIPSSGTKGAYFVRFQAKTPPTAPGSPGLVSSFL